MAKTNKSWFSIMAKDDATADIYIYEEIGLWGISAKDFIEELKGVTAKTINLHLSTPGGAVFDGITIFNSLVSHDARVITHIDGLAASIGSIIALAGDEVNMAENAFYMIHNPWVITMGDADELRKSAEMLDKIQNTLVNAYTDKTGLSEAEIIQLMADETWFTAEDALSSGFVDNVTAKREEAACFDLSKFHNVPAALAYGAARIPTERELEGVLRDAAGLSRTEAKTLLSGGISALKQRDAVSEEIKPQEKNKAKEKDIMDINVLKKDHSEVYDAIMAEGRTAGMAAGIEEGKAVGIKEGTLAGATAESERIKGVYAHLRPGREELINKLMFDGETSGAEAANAILLAEDMTRDKVAAAIKADASVLIEVTATEPPTEGTEPKDFEGMVEAYREEHTCSKGAAIAAIAREHPDAHKAYLKKENKSD